MEIHEIVSKILLELESKIAPRVALLEINQWAKDLMDKYGVESVNYQYKPAWAKIPFPGYLCTSVNDTIAHGVPSSYRLVEGDIINLDLGIKRGKECADAGFTIPVGKISNKDFNLLKYTVRILYAGIIAIKDGAHVSEIGKLMNRASDQYGFNVNVQMTGHAIGKEMHMKPYIPHFYAEDDQYKKIFDGVLKEGMIVCLEPMVTYGNDRAGYFSEDTWSFLTKDHKNSAMFEHMVRVEKDGFKILTTHFDYKQFERGGKYENLL